MARIESKFNFTHHSPQFFISATQSKKWGGLICFPRTLYLTLRFSFSPFGALTVLVLLGKILTNLLLKHPLLIFDDLFQGGGTICWKWCDDSINPGSKIYYIALLKMKEVFTSCGKLQTEIMMGQSYYIYVILLITKW